MAEYGRIHTDGSRSGGQPVLKPCPFCGSAFKMGQEPHDNFPVSGMYYIYHDYGPLGSAARECPVDVMGHFNSADEAIAAWNNRPADRIEALEAEVERLREALKRIQHFSPAHMWLAPDIKVIISAALDKLGFEIREKGQ